MNRGQLPARLLPTHLTRGDGPERLSGRNTICRNTPSHIMSPTRSQPGSSAEVSLGVRGHTPAPQRAHAPPSARVPPASTPTGEPLTQTTQSHRSCQQHQALDRAAAGQVSSSAATSRGSACASSGPCSRPPRAARQLSAWRCNSAARACASAKALVQRPVRARLDVGEGTSRRNLLCRRRRANDGAAVHMRVLEDHAADPGP